LPLFAFSLTVGYYSQNKRSDVQLDALFCYITKYSRYGFLLLGF